ncbi:MAG TPA: PEP-CTERM sorting domain-containing protein [Candidatus Acidoferrum sp.]|nr:PEP-CTERM sorting domain-containing protein [Candidatus Acidoferrum sp.]
MILKKLYCLAALGLGVCFICSVSAQDYHWTGNGLDGLWSNAANWDNGVPAPNVVGGIFLDPNANGSVMTIGPGDVESPGTIGNNHPPYGTIFGPEWGATLNIYGSLHYDWYLAPVQNVAANPSTINMYGSSSLSGEGIALGYNWWWNGGPYVNMNMYDNSAVNINFFFWGGHLNLYGGTFTTGGVADGSVDAVSDATRMMNLAGGKLILSGDATTTVNGWISRGVLEGYGVAGAVAIDTITDPGYTIVTGVVPEPSCIALLGVGGLLSAIFLKRRAAV